MTVLPATSSPGRPLVYRILAWSMSLLVLAGALFFLGRSGTPVGSVAILALFLLWGVLLPGWLVHRGLRGPQESWVADVSLAAATGIALGLGCWALFSIVDLRDLLWAWPLLTLPVLASRLARSRIFSRPTGHWGPVSTVAMGLAALLAMWHMDNTFLAASELPPSGQPYYPDLLWHLGLSAEAARSLPLGTPQLVGDGVLHYHWFSNAYVATMSLMTGLDVPSIMLRLWILPFILVTTGLTASLATKLSGRPWAGAGAALMVQAMVPYHFAPGVLMVFNHFSGYSPSQYFAYPMMLLTLHALVDVCRGTAVGRGTYAVLALGALGASGAKTSALPVILGGLAIATVAALFQRRRRAVLAILTAGLALLTVLALGFVSGGDTGSGIQLFSNLTIHPAYRLIVTKHPDLHTTVVSGLFDTPGVGLYLFLGLMGALLLSSVRALAFVTLLFHRRLRTDLGAWLVAGVCASAFVPLLVIAHAGYSEYYFLYGAIPPGAALLMYAVSDYVGDDRRRMRAAWVAGGATAAVVFLVGLQTETAANPGTRAAMIHSLKVFVVQVAVVAALAAVLVLVGMWLARRGADWVRPALVGAFIGSLLVAPVVELATAPDPRAVRAATKPNPQNLAETEAALWIQHNVAADALMATNTHCLKGTGLTCDARRWWLSGLGGRRVLLEGWAYSPRAVANGGYYDPALYQLNQAVFERPTPALIERMRRLGVGWLVAERDNGLRVSGALEVLARKRYDNARVTIYELPP